VLRGRLDSSGPVCAYTLGIGCDGGSAHSKGQPNAMLGQYATEGANARAILKRTLMDYTYHMLCGACAYASFSQQRMLADKGNMAVSCPPLYFVNVIRSDNLDKG
jgi:hypothetical protein